MSDESANRSDVAQINRAELLARLDEERRVLAREGEVLVILPLVTRAHSTDKSHHWVISSRLTDDTADAAIAQEIDHHRQLGVGFEWKLFSHDRPADLLQRLKHHGFKVGPHEAMLAYPLQQQAAWIQNESAEVVRIDRPEQIADFRAVAEAVFKKDYSFTSNELAAALRAGSKQHLGYIAYAGDVPVSIGRLYTHPQSWFAGMYGGGTISGYRGQGFYRAVVAARARDGIELGARYLVVDALPTSRPILQRIGFQHVVDTWPCEWEPVRSDD